MSKQLDRLHEVTQQVPFNRRDEFVHKLLGYIASSIPEPEWERAIQSILKTVR